MNKGFTSLILVLSVTGTLLGLTLSSAVESATFFDQALRKKYREMNYYYAYDCIDQAILMVAHDYFFNPTTPISIDNYHCSILSVIPEGNFRTITTRGDYQKAYVYRHAKIELHNQGPGVVWIK